MKPIVMESVPQIGYVGPLAPIIGGIIGALITAVVGYFFIAKRKILSFWITDSEDITLPLRRHHSDISVKVSGREFQNLNRARVFVRNTGNTSIAPCRFDIEMPGEHIQFLAELTTRDADLRNAIQITWDEPQVTNNPRFYFQVSPFLNAKESFEVLLYFDKETQKCIVHCRIEDTKIKLKRGPHLSIKEILSQSEITANILQVTAAALFAIGAFIALIAFFLSQRAR
jgi:hypothetical protein